MHTFRDLHGQVSSEKMWHALPEAGACVRTAPSVAVETTSVAAFVGDVRRQGQTSVSFKGALLPILAAALSFGLLLCIMSDTTSQSFTGTPIHAFRTPSLQPIAADAHKWNGRVQPETPSGGCDQLAGFDSCHLVDQLPTPRMQSYPSTPREPVLASTLAPTLAMSTDTVQLIGLNLTGGSVAGYNSPCAVNVRSAIATL